MRASILRGLVLGPAVIVLFSCSDGEERREVDGMVTFNTVSTPTFHATAVLTGMRYIQVHTVTWQTSAGASGPATLTVQRNCFALFFIVSECNHGWTAAIPLVVGVNSISLFAEGDDGEWGQATVTITRQECPPNFSPSSCD